MKKDVKKVISPQGTDPVAVKDPICPKGFGCPFLINLRTIAEPTIPL